ncbi:MAG: hypothetical protein AB1Z98_23380 [Nannocystaceae bacterium]
MRRIPGLALGAVLLVGCDGGETTETDGALLLLQPSSEQPERDELGQLVTVQTRGGQCVALLTDPGTGRYDGVASATTCWSTPPELSAWTVTISPSDGEATVRAFLLGETDGEGPGFGEGQECGCADGLGVLAQGVLVVDGTAREEQAAGEDGDGDGSTTGEPTEMATGTGTSGGVG